MNTQLHLGAEDCSRFFSVSHANARQYGPFFPGCACSSKSDNLLPEKCTIYPRIGTPLPATCTVLHALTID